MPATSQLDWLSSTTAMIVLFWSRATRDLLKSFGWGIAALHRLDAATKLPFLAARPIASLGPPSAATPHAAGTRPSATTRRGSSRSRNCHWTFEASRGGARRVGACAGAPDG